MPEIEKGHTITPTRAMKERGEAMASSFEHYCRERWQFARNYANKLIASSQVISNLGTTVPIQPISERQARPLTKLEPEQQKEVRHSILCLHSPWQGRIKKSETGKSGNSHRLLTTRLNEVSEWLECSLHKLILFNNCLVPISQHSMNALTSSACTVV